MVESRIASVLAIEVAHVRVPRSIRVLKAAFGRGPVDVLNAHRLKDARLAWSVQPDVHGAGVVAEHDRRGAAQDHAAATGGPFANDLLGHRKEISLG